MPVASIPPPPAVVTASIANSKVTAASHGFTSADVGKPLALKAQHVWEVWDDTVDPDTGNNYVAVLKDVIDTSTIELAWCGCLLSVVNSLLPPSGLPASGSPGVNDRLLFWDKSLGRYTQTLPTDSKLTREVLLYVGVDGSKSRCLVLIPANPIAGPI